MKISDYPTASQVNAIQHHVDITKGRLANDTLAQAEAIANHYVAHAHIAQQLRKLVEMSRRCKSCCAPGVDQVIDFMVAQIKSGHLHDLGLFLEWGSALPNEKHAEKQSDGSPALQSELQVRVPPRDPIPVSEWPTLEGRLANPIRTDEEARAQLKANGVPPPPYEEPPWLPND